MAITQWDIDENIKQDGPCKDASTWECLHPDYVNNLRTKIRNNPLILDSYLYARIQKPVTGDRG